jgi:hypothetical protein
MNNIDWKTTGIKVMNIAALAGGATVAVGAAFEAVKHFKAKSTKGVLGSLVVVLVGVYAVNASLEKLK